MSRISSFVFFDLETTGLPWQEKNATKIIELSAVAVLRRDLENTAFEHMPPVSKMTYVLNPQRPIHPIVCRMTGFTNQSLVNAPLFKQKIEDLNIFLEKQPKPVCLVAHNGNNFDYKIFLAEINDANASLPSDLLCIDSLVGFRELLKGTNINYEHLKTLNLPTSTDNFTDDEDDPEGLLTDDDDWPELNLSNQDWENIDDLCDSTTDMSCSDSDGKKKMEIKKKRIQERRSECIRNIFKSSSKETKIKEVKPKEVFNLSALYKRLLNKEEPNAHRAEIDCLMLIQCVVALKDDFLPWADKKCKLLTEIEPLRRYRSFKK